MIVRRVVTGHSSTGNSVFASDSPVEPIALMLQPGLAIHRPGLITVPPESIRPMPSGIGAAPALSGDRYQPVTLVDNNPGRHGRALAAQIAYLPAYATRAAPACCGAAISSS